jgi:hypothetical protein
MICVAKSSLERTRVPRRVTDHLTVGRLANINTMEEPPMEVKRLKPPRRKVARQPVVPLRAPKVDYSDACFQ